MATAAGSVQPQGHGARFAAACDVLSRYVKAASAATTTTVEQPRPPPAAAVLPLMPGADLSTTPQEEEPEAAEAGPAPAPSANQPMTISYGGRVVVLDDVPADRAAELLRLASAAAAQGGAAPRVLRAPDDDLPMARKASLRQFMEKRRGRVAARGSPYSRPADAGKAAAAAALQRGYGTPVGRYPCGCGPSISALRFAAAVNEEKTSRIFTRPAR